MRRCPKNSLEIRPIAHIARHGGKQRSSPLLNPHQRRLDGNWFSIIASELQLPPNFASLCASKLIDEWRKKCLWRIRYQRRYSAS
jgi:hypothetical protein